MLQLVCNANLNRQMSIIEIIQTQLAEGKYCAGVFVGLKKAFDTINHNTVYY